MRHPYYAMNPEPPCRADVTSSLLPHQLTTLVSFIVSPRTIELVCKQWRDRSHYQRLILTHHTAMAYNATRLFDGRRALSIFARKSCRSPLNVTDSKPEVPLSWPRGFFRVTARSTLSLALSATSRTFTLRQSRLTCREGNAALFRHTFPSSSVLHVSQPPMPITPSFTPLSQRLASLSVSTHTSLFPIVATSM